MEIVNKWGDCMFLERDREKEREVSLFLWSQDAPPTRGGEGVNPLGGSVLPTLGESEAVASWLSKQADAPQVMMLNHV